MKKTIFITGASTGIGKETAIYFSEKGWNVVATMRDPSKWKSESKEISLDIIPLDVLDTLSIREAIQYTIKKYGNIDVLVNNAGFALRGAFESSTHEEVKKQYDANVLGLMDVTREIIPVFRNQNGGTIINVASVGGRMAFPFYSLYNSSKWAVDGFSEALRYELEPFHIKVKAIEPGVIKTDFYNRSMVISKKEGLDIYDKMLENSIKKTTSAEKAGSHPRVIAKLIYRAANDKSSKLRYSAGSNAGLIFFMRRILPDGLFFAIIKAFSM